MRLEQGNDLVLGVDTGGTNTDGVLLDLDSRQVLATTKTPTTPFDLSQCILDVFDDLLPSDPARIKLVAISTTLATNAIAEGKGRPVGLLLLGYDRQLAERFHFQDRYSTRQVAYIQGGHDVHGEAQGPLDRQAVRQIAQDWRDEIEAVAVSGYFSPLNPSHEEAVANLIRDRVGLPVVLGHQLSSKLNSVERATTAALNGGLMSILGEFIEAMSLALEERGVTAPLMIMRGDGALTRARLVSDKPVETIHSGPVASAIGGSYLAALDRALVVDMGGTTTDLAIVDSARVRVREDGTEVGPFRTAVRSADVRSFALGGDSLISLNAEDQLTVGPARVTPISMLAGQHPQVAAGLRGRAGTMMRRPSPDSLEYWYLERVPRRQPDHRREREALELLDSRPHALPELLDRLGLIHPIQFGGPRLVREGIIGRGALTPTDLLHLTNEFTPWDGEAAEIATEFMARLGGLTVPELIGRVKEGMAEGVVAEIVAYISGRSVERAPFHISAQDLGTWLFEESLHPHNPYLRSEIKLDLPLVGIGAPAGVFLPRVAEMLGTELVLPAHYEVANAVGSVAGSVIVTKDAWIYPQMRNMHIAGYYAQHGGRRERHADLQSALEDARHALEVEAIDEARQAGAAEPSLEFERLPDGAESYRLQVRAVGNPRLDREARRVVSS